MSASESTYEGWAILELMGHRRLAGYVQEVELAGHGMIRLDVPEHLFNDGDGDAPSDVVATQFYSPSALYCLTPTTEEVARSIATNSRPRPAQRWELAAPAPPPPDLDEAIDDAHAALLETDTPSPPLDDRTGTCECGHGDDLHSANGCEADECKCDEYDEAIPF